LVGCVAAVEKGYQGGGDSIRAEGVRVESLAIIDEMSEDKIIFRN
jgi:xanthine phosphoribosyltransferase